MTATEPDDEVATGSNGTLEGHGGDHAMAVARAYGVTTLFTLSGAHVFPMYDAAVKGDPPVRLIDVRHEASAVFAAEATGKLTRTPGLATLTAGPGVTNGISGIAQAAFAGSPMVVIGGRAPNQRWGTGSLQELDHPPIVAPLTRSAVTAGSVHEIGTTVDAAFQAAGSSHRGPAFVDVPMDELFARTSGPRPAVPAATRIEPDPDALATIGAQLARSHRPVLVIGGDVWADRAEDAARRLIEETGIPTVTNGMGRGVLPRGHDALVSKARSAAFTGCDLVVVVGTPLDFRLGFGRFGGRDGADPAAVVHVGDSPGQIATHAPLLGSASGDLSACLTGILLGWQHARSRRDISSWATQLRSTADEADARDQVLLRSDADPIHPARIYGELLPRLADDAVVIGDGGDFVSFAGKFVEPARAGCWLDPGPYGCLGAGLGAAMAARIARPTSQVVLLLGDGAAGLSLLDVDSLVRHRLPVVILVGNNSCWGLEKGPMQMMYGYDVAADLAPRTRYDQVAQALGAGGEMVTEPDGIGPAIDRAFAAGAPYLLNVITDPAAAYPRSTTGI